MLLCVGAEISQGEAVVRGDEVDALGGVPFVSKDVFAPPDASGEVEGGIVSSQPKPACVVSKASVPLGPPSWKSADFVESRGVPRLGDEGTSAEDGIVGDISEQPEVGIVYPFSLV